MKTTTKLFFTILATASLGLGSIACTGDDNTTPAPNPGTDSGTTKDSGTETDTGTNPIDSGSDTSTTTDAGTDAPATLPTGMIDRMGRPAINTACNYGDDPAKDSFNHAETFAAASMTTWDTNFNKNLFVFDSLDGVYQWSADGGTPAAGAVHPLTGPLKLDVLIVDTGKACDASNGYCEGGYLEIEAELLLGGAAHKTCGGRTPPEDVIDKTLSLLALKAGTGVSDGVNAATKPPTRTFPYLAAPN